MSGNESDWWAHPTAVIDAGVEIGGGTRVWHHCHLRSGCRVGSDTNLGKNVYVDADVIVGDGVRVQNNVSIYHGVTLADRVFVGPSAVFTNDLFPRAGNDDFVVTPTHVGRGASLGANCTVVCGNDIGAYAMVAAGSVVTRPVPAFALVVGNPARHAGWVNVAGEVVSRDAERPAGLGVDQ